MRIAHLVLPLALIAGACDSKDTKAAASEAVEKAKSVFADFKQGAQKELGEAKTSLEELKAKAAQAAEEHKPELDKLVSDLEVKRQELATKLTELKDSGAEKLDQAKRDLEPKIAALKEDIRVALDKLKP